MYSKEWKNVLFALFLFHWFDRFVILKAVRVVRLVGYKMLLKQHTEIIINAAPEGIWEFAYNPENWTLSNPEEHRGLVFFNKMNRPETGVEFHQKELVAGFYADLKGQILYAERPRVCVWSGTAIYRVLGGLLKPRIPESGVVQVERVDKGCKVAHDVYMDFPDSIFGKILLWVFKKFFNGQKAVYDHTYRELVYFKERLEK